MNTDRIISALCYFSIFFAGFILPIIVYFVVDRPAVKNHAKSAFLSHLIPLLTVPFIILPIFFIYSLESLAFMAVLVLGLVSLVNIGVIIWNIVKGIQVLSEK